MTAEKECEHDFHGAKLVVNEPVCNKCGQGMLDVRLQNAYRLGRKEEAEVITSIDKEWFDKEMKLSEQNGFNKALAEVEKIMYWDSRIKIRREDWEALKNREVK